MASYAAATMAAVSMSSRVRDDGGARRTRASKASIAAIYSRASLSAWIQGGAAPASLSIL